ncbi:MAG: hypothetical protein AAGD25_03570 [Cyanobacteria bacterium P01_F01_bin.150]
MALLKPRELYEQIRHDLQTLLQGRNPKDYLRFASLVETYAALLPMDVLAEYRPLFIDLADQVAEDSQRSEPIFYKTVETVPIFYKTVETVTLNQRRQEVDRRSHKVPYYQEVLAEDGAVLYMIAIPGNEFWMGTDKDAPEYPSNRDTPKHKVFVAPF